MIALLLLVGGAIVNVAVVGLASMLQKDLGSRTAVTFYSASEDPSWRIERVRGLAFDRLVWNVSVFRGSPGTNFNDMFPGDSPPEEQQVAMPPRWSQMSWDADDEKMFVIVIEDARGWPLLAMRSFTVDPFNWFRAPGGDIVTSGVPLDATYMPAEPWDIRIAPLHPIPSGFIINALFYALLLWLLFALPFAALRTFRRRRGVCGKCAYPVGTSPACSECGAAVRCRSDTGSAVS